MPVKTWATNDVVTASDLNTQYRDQVISTVTSGTRPSGTEGQVIYETDTDLLYIYNGGWVRFGASSGWTSFTPTLTQSSAVTKTVTYAKYEKIGRFVAMVVRLDVTGTGTANSAVTVSPPFTAAAANDIPLGTGYIYDASSGSPFAPAIVSFSTTTALHFIDTTASASVYLGQTGTIFSSALASGDVISISALYEAAT